MTQIIVDDGHFERMVNVLPRIQALALAASYLLAGRKVTLRDGEQVQHLSVLSGRLVVS